MITRDDFFFFFFFLRVFLDLGKNGKSRGKCRIFRAGKKDHMHNKILERNEIFYERKL